ncbi:monocarboxylate transporter 9 [Caerostris extrusa]|uniref:Monocarboxylate transporter 9 n=1 Tax=Caerostris extrusa TaxID=172846 RepID=A0AAV4MQ24_CAEEX|nr:monocarboxylate transporter 9 [Caerostris extrusa]
MVEQHATGVDQGYAWLVATSCFMINFIMAGPLVGLLGQRFGIRGTVLIGGVLAGVGGVLCILAPNVFWITMFWGGVHGIGYGLCNIIHMLLLNEYFDKYKGTAMGFAFSGDCFGTFAFPVILELLLQNYDLNGTFLILGAISFNVIPCAMLLKTPYWLETKTKNAIAGPEDRSRKFSSKRDLQ